MTDDQREEIIVLLQLWTNWNEDALRALDNRKLLEEYDRVLKAR